MNNIKWTGKFSISIENIMMTISSIIFTVIYKYVASKIKWKFFKKTQILAFSIIIYIYYVLYNKII